MTCGGGDQYRERFCVGQAHGGLGCEGVPTQHRTCNENPCPGKTL